MPETESSRGVLVVEDDDVLRHRLCQAFAAAGFHVSEAEGVAAA